MSHADHANVLYPTPRAYLVPAFFVENEEGGALLKMMIELTFKECQGLFRSENRFCHRIVKTDALYDHFNTMKVEKNTFLLLFENDDTHTTLHSSLVGCIADSWMNKYDRLMMIVQIIDVVIPLMEKFLSDALTLISEVVEELDESLELMPNLIDEFPFTIDVMRTKMEDGIQKVLKHYNKTYELLETTLIPLRIDMPRSLKSPKFLKIWKYQKEKKENEVGKWCRTKEYTFKNLEKEECKKVKVDVVLETTVPSCTIKQVNDDEASTKNDDNALMDEKVDPDSMVESGYESPKQNDDLLTGTTTPPKYVAKSNAVTVGSVTATKMDITSKKPRKHVIHSSSKNH
mmetsp:Transcript_3337/g.3788  ORF Transcript_3337/g.3788 Transcript_3337/m.3788 type:complete len:345 (+) Transcript_3337:189-1223(+)